MATDNDVQLYQRYVTFQQGLREYTAASCTTEITRQHFLAALRILDQVEFQDWLSALPVRRRIAEVQKWTNGFAAWLTREEQKEKRRQKRNVEFGYSDEVVAIVENLKLQYPKLCGSENPEVSG